MENLDIIPIIDINEDVEKLTAKLETVKADLSIEEAMREAFSKDLAPKILRRKERYKRVNGVKVPCTEVTIEETLLNDYVKVANCQAQIKENYAKLQKLGAKLKRETSQTELYKKVEKLEDENKQLKMKNKLLKAQIKDRDREIEKLQTQGAKPYIDYEEQIYDLEI